MIPSGPASSSTVAATEFPTGDSRPGTPEKKKGFGDHLEKRRPVLNPTNLRA